MGRALTVELPDDLIADIERRVGLGEFSSPGEMIAVALVSLQDSKAAFWASIEEAGRAGFGQLDSGQAVDGSPAFYDEIRAAVRAQRATADSDD